MPCASVGNSSMSDAMAPCHPPQPCVKKTIAKKRSRLATEGSPSAPTTQEQDTSTMASTQLLKSLGFDFKHANLLEALMCSQDWLHNMYKGGNEDTASFWSCLQEIEDDTKGLALV